MTKRRTLKEFIEKATQIHENKYSYFLSIYKNDKTKINIYCNKHGKFDLLPWKHLDGKGCVKCFKTENFIRKAIKIHGNKYDYTKSEHTGDDKNLTIFCNIHGDFEQTPAKHVGSKHGCQDCGGSKKSTTKEFIEKAILIHGNKFKYNFVEYVNNKTDVKILCLMDHCFEQTPHEHLQGNGCLECSGSKKLTTEEFILKSKLVHGDKYNYILSNYKGNKINIDIICKKHGLFKQSPLGHYGGQGCFKCSVDDRRYTLEEFIEKASKIHNNKYDYSSVVLGKNGKSKLIIKCPIHDKFDQAQINHLSGKGCSLCSPNKRINETIVKQFLINNNIEAKHNFYIKLPNKNNYSKAFIDFYIPSLNLFIEYNGGQHYEPVTFGGISKIEAAEKFKKQQIRDFKVNQYCKDNNIKLLEIDGRKYQNKTLIEYLNNKFKQNNVHL